MPHTSGPGSQFTPKVIKIKLKDSVSISEGGGGSVSRPSSGGGSKSKFVPPPPQRSSQSGPVFGPSQKDKPTQKKGKNFELFLTERIRLKEKKKLKAKEPFGASKLTSGALAFAKLRELPDEARKDFHPLAKAAFGFAEGAGSTVFAVGSLAPLAFLDTKAAIEGKPFRAKGSKSADFVDAVQSEFRPSTLGQAISQLGPNKKDIKFDITGISRSAGEVAPFLLGGGKVSVTASAKSVKL